jgi:multiple sugar transport system permease protein
MTERKKQEQRFAFLMISPSLIFLILMFTFPLLYLVGISTFRMELARPTANAWIGIDNYMNMLNDPRFWNSMKITVIYTVSTVCLQVILGMSMALALSDNMAGKFRDFLRIVVLLPMILAPVVVGLVWRTLLLTQRYGLIDFIFMQLGFGTQPWLGDPTYALLSVIAIHTWQWTPFAFLVFLASLASISPDLYEAALLDRASSFQRFWYITLPMLRSSIVIVVIIRLMVALRAFAAIFSATGGGPGTSTEILNLLAYRTSFNSLNIGYGAALGTTLLVITSITSLLLFKIRKSSY